MKNKKFFYLLAALFVIVLAFQMFVRNDKNAKFGLRSEDSVVPSANHSVVSNEKRVSHNDEPSSPEEVAADRVREIYARIIANGRDSVEAGALSYDSRLFDTRDYLSADYYQWYKKTEDYDNAKGNEGWRFFSYDHWGTLTEYNGITKAKVARTEDLPDGRIKVRVELECASYNIGEKTPCYTAPEVVTLILVKERDGCFVDDFLDKDGDSEKAQMKEYLKTEQTQSRPDGHLNIVNPLPR